MPKKYNNKSPLYADWTTQKLKKATKAYYESINITECYGTKDIIAYDIICEELYKRGWEIRQTGICFVKI